MGGGLGHWLGLVLAGLLVLSGSGCKHRQHASKRQSLRETTAQARMTSAPRETGCPQVERPVPPLPSSVPEGNQPAKQPDAVELRWQVAGWGLTPSEAVQDAQRRAAQKVTDYLRRQPLPFHGSVSVAQIRDHLQTGAVQREPSQDQDIADGALAPAQCWVISIDISPARLELIRQENEQAWRMQLRAERRAVASQRLLALSPPLAGILALLFGLWLWWRC